MRTGAEREMRVQNSLEIPVAAQSARQNRGMRKLARCYHGLFTQSKISPASSKPHRAKITQSLNSHSYPRFISCSSAPTPTADMSSTVQ